MSVHYKFKSAKEYSTITFDTPFISLADLKQRIIHQQKLGRGPDFDLEVVNAQTKEVYTDNNKLVPKNSSVIVSRVPANKASTSIQPEVQVLKSETQVKGSPKENEKEAGVDEEIEAIQNLVETADDWKTRPAPISGGEVITPHHRGAGGHGKSHLPSVPPPSYICHRCGKPGHFIQFCPTNSDPNFNIHRVKKPTGIPKSFLTPVPESEAHKAGTLMMPGGGFAKMTPNEYVLITFQEC